MNKTFSRRINTYHKRIYIGDIIYGLDEDIRERLWESTDFSDGIIDDSTSEYAIVVNIPYKKGLFNSLNGESFSVDNGNIGIVNLDYPSEAVDLSFGHVVQLPSSDADCILELQDGNVFVSIKCNGSIVYENTILTNIIKNGRLSEN